MGSNTHSKRDRPLQRATSSKASQICRPRGMFALFVVVVPFYLLITHTPLALAPSSSTFCPPYNPRQPHIPTVILQATGDEYRADNRTYWVTGEAGDVFLPKSWPLHELRFAQRPMEMSSNWDDPEDRYVAATSASSSQEEAKVACPVHVVPSSLRPIVPKHWKTNQIMFGMSTLPDRVLFNLPVWSHWLPSHGSAFEPSVSITSKLPLVLILIPPPNPTEEARAREALDEAQTLGLNIEIRSLEAGRFEMRYLALVEEMWAEAQKREEKEGVVTEWFVFADDDTFFPDVNSMVRMLASYDSSQDVLLGALSECYKQVQMFGHMAFGGAGIFISRSLMKKMNTPGHYDSCARRFGAAFGGDAMTSLCAALAINSTATTEHLQQVTLPTLLTLDQTLHQLDIRGDSTGFFQSGFLITSLHHWASWFTLFPPWHEMGLGDVRKTIKTIGMASKLLGGDNFGRRYVFETGKVVISLGYSVVLYAQPVTPSMLAKTEHTWYQLESYHPLRDAQEESLDKRTYYLTSVRPIESGVVRLEHTNREGERVDVLWDGRAGESSPHSWEKEKSKWAAWTAANAGTVYEAPKV